MSSSLAARACMGQVLLQVAMGVWVDSNPPTHFCWPGKGIQRLLAGPCLSQSLSEEVDRKELQRKNSLG